MKKWYSICFGSLFLYVAFAAAANEGRMSSVIKNPVGTTYFEVNIKDDGLLNGNFKGWCGNWTFPIEQGVEYNVKFYSSYAPTLPEGLVDHPEHLDEVNWILNKRFVNQNAPMGLGVYTVGDVQLAIWTLLDNFFDDSTIGAYSQARVDMIVKLATELGANYIPKCRDVIGIILEPISQETGARAQTVVTEVPLVHFPKCVVPDDEDSLTTQF